MFVRFQFAKAATLLSALTTLSVIAPVAASAEERPVLIFGESAYIRSERVSFAKLDLTSARDQKRLSNRVGAAVERVCLRDIGRDGLQDTSYYSCVAKAWNGALPQIADATRRAAELAMSGSSTIAATAISVSAS